MKMPPPAPADTLRIIASKHAQATVAGGMGTGECEAGCLGGWPCETVHLAQGHGLLERCQDEGWCVHYGVKVEPFEDPDYEDTDPDDDWDPNWDT